MPADSSAWTTFANHCLTGLVNGSLYALIALGYTLVYGILELINFAHGDVFMLGACLTLTLAAWLTWIGADGWGAPGVVLQLAVLLAVVPLFCAGLNVGIDRLVYRPLRNAPRLAPLVSAIGVSFILMNVGLLWIGASDRDVPNLVSRDNLLGPDAALRITLKDLLVLGTTVPIMIGLTLFVKHTRLGVAMRATAQNPTAARLMGVNVESVIAATFALGGGLAGLASVVYALHVNSVNFQRTGFDNGMYAFTAAVLGGIGNLPGAVLGGLLIGLARSLSDGYGSASWTPALVFVILIVVLVFRPAGLLGSTAREKV